MNIVCEKFLLIDAVTNVSRAVSPKSVLPSLEGVLIKVKNNEMKISGYDLEMGISTVIPCKMEEGGDIVISAKLFLEMIKKMSGDNVHIEVDEKLLCTIKSGVTEYTIIGLPAKDFPELPTISESSRVKISQYKLKSMISQTHFAIAQTDAKPVHTGSMFDIAENNAKLISVDGFRLAMRNEKMDTSENHIFIVPGKTLSEVEKMLSEEDDEVVIDVSRKHIIFNINGYEIISRLLDGDFLDYKSAIPKSSTTTVTIKVKDFINSIERTSLLISDKIKSPLRIKFHDNMIKISCSTSIGKAYDEMKCQIKGEEIEIGFNSRYLLDALKASGCDEIVLEINGPLSPMRILPTQGEDFLFLVLPVRLKSE